MIDAKGLFRIISCKWFDSMTAKFEKYLLSHLHFGNNVDLVRRLPLMGNNVTSLEFYLLGT